MDATSTCNGLQVMQALSAANQWSFDAFELSEITNGHGLSALGYFLIASSGLVQVFKINGTTLAK